MRKLITMAFWLLVALLAANSRFSVDQSAFAGQGKGGEVIAKPTPTPKKRARTTRSTALAFRPANPGIELVKIPSGNFMMGSTNGEADEKPVHRVAIKYSFYVGKYEVTQAQWRAVMGDDFLPSGARRQLYESGVGNEFPLYNASWDDVQGFVKRLNRLDTRYEYRLPTEAEWEYACRAGTSGDDNGNVDLLAWYVANSNSTTHPVGTKQPNAFGLYDMRGNVYEWCEDFFDSDYYRISPSDDPKGPANGTYRVIRGGGWQTPAQGAQSVRASSRISFPPKERSTDVGFRVVALRRTK